MERLAIILYLVAATINLLPVSGVFGADRLEALYALPFEDANLTVLMRHRAVLFGIVGGLLLGAAFHAPLRNVATVAGLISMTSYALIVLLADGTNDALRRVFWVDILGIIALLGAALIQLRTSP